MKKIKNKSILMVFVFSIMGCSVNEDAVVEKFIGTYRVNDECGRGGTTTFDITILPKNKNIDEIIIENFGGYNGTITAKVDNENLSFNDMMGNLKIVGKGIIDSNRKNIQFTYSTIGNNITDNCSSNALKY